MVALIYKNLTDGITIKEYCFASYAEKRRLFLEKQYNIEFLMEMSMHRPFLSVEWFTIFWKCLTHETWDITPCEKS